MPIPKIIHFTWKTKTLTKFAQRTWDEWERTHPDWQLKLWDDVDIRALVADQYPEQLDTFEGYPTGIFRADAWRFFVLHHEGGVYADLDVLPLGRIDELCGTSDCFVGAEPEVHVENNDGRYRGMPFLLCNAFMGSVPGHPFWQRCIDALARCSATSDVVDATGPRLVHGVGLCTPQHERPDVLLPNYWSPISGWGKPSPTSDAYADAVAREFTTFGRGEPAVVSHLWRNSWFMPVYYKGPAFWKRPNKLEWWWWTRSAGDLARVTFPSPTQDYTKQIFEVPASLPPIFAAVDVQEGASAELGGLVAGLSYPKHLLTVGIFGGTNEVIERLTRSFDAAGIASQRFGAVVDRAERHNAMAKASRGKGHLLILDGRLTFILPGTIESMVAVDRPVVTVEVVAQDGSDRNEASMLYNAGVFKAMYRAGAQSGDTKLVASGAVLPLLDFRYLTVAPLTTVGTDLLLVQQQVLDAGVRFAEEPYKFHRDERGFALMARDKGFEVAGLPNVTVVTSR